MIARLLIISGIILYSATLTRAQELIKGIVVDSATFNPLPWVTVQVKHQANGTTTDEDGNFSLYATQSDTLILSLVGYNTLEQPLTGWEPSVILLSANYTLLQTITIHDTRIDNPYEGLFDEENAKLREVGKRLPFYYSKSRKQKIRVGHLENENYRVKTYVEVVINNPALKENLIKRYSLTEQEYYRLLTKFNEQNFGVMYYITAGELISLINNFFDRHISSSNTDG